MKLQTFTDIRGSLTVIEKLPFNIKRVYYLYGMPPDVERGGHKHIATERVIIAINGGFDVEIGKFKLHMNAPDTGLFVPKMTWLKLSKFLPGSICLVLASTEHDENDCVR